MSNEQTRISVKGKQVSVRSTRVGSFDVVITGRALRQAVVKGEDWVTENPASNPEQIISALRGLRPGVDLFSFAQRVPDTEPQFSYPMRWDNAAALPLMGYSEWWEKRLSQDTRRNVRLAAKRGLIVKEATFDDCFVEGIKGIYDETPVRQGRRFWHYGKDFETVKRENGTFSETSQFIGAYCGDELVGFMKIVFAGKLASIMQILSKTSHYEKRPMNALMAKAVEICNQKEMTHLLYRKYVYRKNTPDALTEFKRRNGFEQVMVPRYFVPLSLKGQLAIALNLQAGVHDFFPQWLVSGLRRFRSSYYQRRGMTETVPNGQITAAGKSI